MLNPEKMLRFAFWPFAFVGCVTYFYVLSNGTWMLFVDEWMGRVYNDYFFAIVDGRLDIGPEHIKWEGFYIDDKVYTYFGALPALLRGLWAPFVDLGSTDVSRPTLWIVLCVAAFVSQYLVLMVCRRTSGTSASGIDAGLIVVLWAVVWFGSPTMLLAANASVYHQPIAMAYLLMVLFVLVLLKSTGPEGDMDPRWLPLMAVIAGASVHARLNVAIGLYTATVVVCAHHLLAAWREGAIGERWAGIRTLTLPPIPRVAAALLLLFVAGALLLIMNWARWGHPLVTAPMEYYGVNLFHQAGSDRFASATELGSFNLRRIPANLSLYLASLMETHNRLADLFGAGHIRFEPPTKGILYLWPLPAFLVLRVAAARSWDLPGKALRILLFATVPCAILVLAFQTVTFRYMTDLFLVLFVLMLAAIPSTHQMLGSRRPPLNWIYLGVVALLAGAGIYLMFEGIYQYKELAWMAAADSPPAFREH